MYVSVSIWKRGVEKRVEGREMRAGRREERGEARRQKRVESREKREERRERERKGYVPLEGPCVVVSVAMREDYPTNHLRGNPISTEEIYSIRGRVHQPPKL